MQIRVLDRAQFTEDLDALAQLRITVFADWPYLYEGDLAYERDYLSAYCSNDSAFIAGAFAGEQMVGACTASPLSAHHNEFAAPLAQAGYDVSTLFYFGESVLLSAYRGQGIGHRFFDLREAEARAKGFSACVFSAVIRPEGHPARPQNYQPLDAFWRKRGFRRLDGVKAHYSWRDIGETMPTAKPMAYWLKSGLVADNVTV